MGYVEDNLLPGEKVVLKANPHWAIFIGPMIVLIFGCVLAFIFASNGSGSPTDNSRATASLMLLCIAVPIILAGIGSAISMFFSYLTTEFAVTDKRVIAKTGLIRRRSIELLLNKVESIGVTQPLMGRVFDYGTLVVVGTGGTKEGFPFIAGPMSFRKRVNAQIAGQSAV